MHETERTWQTDDGIELVGSIGTPDGHDGATPAALVLSGSGPVDRDSNMDGQRTDIARSIAVALAEVGVASLRFDKRGTGASGGDYLRTGFEREVADAASALEELRSSSGIDSDRVGIVGHSVGAAIAMRLAAATFNAPAAFAVLLAGAAQSGRDVMAWQSDRIADTLPGPSWLVPAGFRLLQARSRCRIEASSGDTMRAGRTQVPARWFREYMAHDPAVDLPAINCPVLAVTGGKDLQVDVGDLRVIADCVVGPCRVEAPADLTHLLRSTLDRPAITQYRALLEQPVDAELTDLVAGWTREASGPPVMPSSPAR